jgi:hypothetical protein
MKQDIKDKVIKYLLIGLAVIIFVLSMITIRSCKKIDAQKRTIETINAMNDSIVKKVNGKDTFWEKSVITMDPKQIIKEGIKSTNPETNKFIEELAKTKKLVSALQVEIQVKETKYTDLVKVVKLRDSLENEVVNECDAEYDFKDSSIAENKNFKYFGKVFINNNTPKLKLNYEYKVKIKSVVTEDKKGYTAKYSLDDSNASVIGADQIYIPKPSLSKKQKAKNILIPTLTGAVGFAAGYGTSQAINYYKK